MSILIKGLEMPKGDEMLCINIYPDGKVCIDLDLHCKRVATAVSVPPHGDLIDAQEEMRLMQSCDYDTYDDYNRAFDMLDNAPTIIPAEEGGQ